MQKKILVAIRRYLGEYLIFCDEVFFKHHLLVEIRSFPGSFFHPTNFTISTEALSKKTKMIIFKSCKISAKYRFRTQIPSFEHQKDALNTVLGREISCNIDLLMLLESYKNVWKAMRGHKTSFEVILRKKQNLVTT